MQTPFEEEQQGGCHGIEMSNPTSNEGVGLRVCQFGEEEVTSRPATE